MNKHFRRLFNDNGERTGHLGRRDALPANPQINPISKGVSKSFRRLFKDNGEHAGELGRQYALPASASTNTTTYYYYFNYNYSVVSIAPQLSLPFHLFLTRHIG